MHSNVGHVAVVLIALVPSAGHAALQVVNTWPTIQLLHLPQFVRV